jgi:hypothetical protein
MEQQDRDLLIRMDERLQSMQKAQVEHKQESKEAMQESKEAMFAVQSELKSQSLDIAKLKIQNKPLIYKLFAYLFMAKGG